MMIYLPISSDKVLFPAPESPVNQSVNPLSPTLPQHPHYFAQVIHKLEHLYTYLSTFLLRSNKKWAREIGREQKVW